MSEHIEFPASQDNQKRPKKHAGNWRPILIRRETLSMLRRVQTSANHERLNLKYVAEALVKLALATTEPAEIARRAAR